MKIKKVIWGLLLMAFLSGCGIAAPLVTKETPKYSVSFYLMVNQKSPAYNRGIVPAGSLVLSCGEFLTLRKEPTMVSTDRAKTLTASLKRLLALQLSKDNFYMNNISAQNTLNLAGVDVNEGIANVRLSGELKSTGNTCYDGAMKFMVEKTVQEAGFQPNILVNDSAREWTCLFSADDSCKTVNTLKNLKQT